jgi:hypothetical protein
MNDVIAITVTTPTLLRLASQHQCALLHNHHNYSLNDHKLWSTAVVATKTSPPKRSEIISRVVAHSLSKSTSRR